MPHRIFVDLTNLITYAAHFNKISGVQRVEIELIKQIANHQNTIGMFNLFDGDSTGLVERMMRLMPNEEKILPFLKKEFSYRRLVPDYDRDGRSGFLKSTFKTIAGSFKTKALKLGAGDIVFVPGGFGFSTQILKFYRKLAARHVRLVFLIHDVFPITRPDLTAPGSAAFFSPAFALPDEIITTTRFNAADFLRAHEIATKTVCKSVPHVIPLAHEFPGAQRNLKPGEASRRLSDALQGKPFVASIGTIEIRKNHAVLMQAWRALQQELGEKLPLLVIAGRRGWQAQDALDLLDHAQETTAPYVFIEGPTDEELKWLYASCEFSVLPSLFEGWGLPVGESLWFGKACAASKTSSIPEVGRDLCVYFDPNDPDDMKAAIKRLLDPVTRKAFEDKIRAADLRQWSDVARDLIAVLLNMTDAPEAA